MVPLVLIGMSCSAGNGVALAQRDLNAVLGQHCCTAQACRRTGLLESQDKQEHVLSQGWLGCATCMVA